MSILASYPSMNVVELFSAMNVKTNDLIECIAKESNSIWLPEWQDYPGEPLTTMDSVRSIFEDIWYLGDEDGRSTRTYQGVIMGSKNIIHKAIELNNAKDNFHRAIKSLVKASGNASTIKIKEEFSKFFIEEDRDRLATIGLIRLNLNSCYRKIPFFDVCPLKIGYSKQNSGASITKITKSEAIAMLEKEGEKGKNIEDQIRLLDSISIDEPMAKVQTQSPIIKANIKFTKPYKDSNLVRLTKKPPLPIIIPTGHPFEVNFIDPEAPSHSRLKRSDRLIEEDAFLSSIRVHRYKKR